MFTTAMADFKLTRDCTTPCILHQERLLLTFQAGPRYPLDDPPVKVRKHQVQTTPVVKPEGGSEQNMASGTVAV